MMQDSRAVESSNIWRYRRKMRRKQRKESLSRLDVRLPIGRQCVGPRVRFCQPQCTTKSATFVQKLRDPIHAQRQAREQSDREADGERHTQRRGKAGKGQLDFYREGIHSADEQRQQTGNDKANSKEQAPHGHDQSRMALSAPSFTRSRRSLPGLKCGTFLPESATVSPVLGLRPCRGGRKWSEKLPKPRISMRLP